MAGQILRDCGLRVIDTDTIARDLVAPGQPALDEIRAQFGEDIIDPRGIIRRDELARLVFADAESRRSLEGILHPRIREVWEAEVQTWRKENVAAGAVVIPLLFETQAGPLFNATVCVACGAATQFHRLRERGWNHDEIRRRIDSQWPIEKKIGASDYVIWTYTTLEAHGAQWRHLLSRHESR